ncbi:hypothetical protein JYQ62_20930 [Nostoc sp. UHCC 0702]|nr:hypothetical protein JYQ62_20930 [Nostoc sp. UHCC 0702]
MNLSKEVRGRIRRFKLGVSCQLSVVSDALSLPKCCQLSVVILLIPPSPSSPHPPHPPISPSPHPHFLLCSARRNHALFALLVIKGLGTGYWGLGTGKNSFNAQFPMPHTQCPMPHTQLPNLQCLAPPL